jgi:MoaA/NifB/PqqE/SkfB family radical SAM enzyme
MPDKYFTQISAERFPNCVSERDKLSDAELLLLRSFGLAVVYDEIGNFKGIITQADISKARAENSNNIYYVADAYNKTPMTISISKLNAMELTGQNPFSGVKHKSIVVTDCGKFHSLIFTFALHLDIVNACNLQCYGCCRGRREIKNTNDKMDIFVYERVIAKVVDFGLNCIHLYNWAEPFLCEDLNDYISLADRYGLESHLSTNLSLPAIDNLEDILYSGSGTIMVSVSGFTQSIHERYHYGGDIETVKNHLREISKYWEQRPFQMNVYVKFLDFGYNTAEIPAFSEWINSLNGIGFSVSQGLGNPIKRNGIMESDTPPRAIREECEFFRTLSVDHNGDVYPCCRLPNKPEYRIGNLVTENSVGDMVDRKRTYSFCCNCQDDCEIKHN